MTWSHISLICKTGFDKSTCLWRPGSEPAPEQVHKEYTQSATSFSKSAAHTLPRTWSPCWALLREQCLSSHPTLTSSLGLLWVLQSLFPVIIFTASQSLSLNQHLEGSSVVLSQFPGSIPTLLMFNAAYNSLVPLRLSSQSLEASAKLASKLSFPNTHLTSNPTPLS